MPRYHHEQDDDADRMKPHVVQLPADLNKDSVAEHLIMINRTQPQQLPGVVRAIREKWVHHWAKWVEEERSRYLDTLLQQLKIYSDILQQGANQHDILAAHRRRREAEQAERDEGVISLEAQQKAQELRARIEESKAKQAEARKKRLDIENPSVPEPPKREITAEEKRQANLNDADAKVNRLRQRMTDRLAEILAGRTFDQLSPEEQEEYRGDENMYMDRIRRAKEERLQYE
jgi:hypothetical protein